MKPAWARVHAELLLLMAGCLSFSFIEVARPIGPRSREVPQSQFRVGDGFPVLAGRDENGPVRISVPEGGELALVFVVSPFCSVCDDEAPNLRRVIAEVFPPGVRPLPIDVILVCLSPLDLAREFMAKQGLTGHVLAVNTNNPSGDEELQTAWLFSSTPEAFLVGPDGRILLQSSGLSDAKAEQWVARLWTKLDGK